MHETFFFSGFLVFENLELFLEEGKIVYAPTCRLRVCCIGFFFVVLFDSKRLFLFGLFLVRRALFYFPS